MIKNDVLNECARRLGDTSADFLTILGTVFDFVVLELAQKGLISSLRKQGSFVFNTGAASNGLLNFNTRTIASLVSPLYPAVHRLLVPAWGSPYGILQKKGDQEFEEYWVLNGVNYTGRPQHWRLYPNEQQLQVWPNADADSATATCLFEYTAPPSTLAGGADIVEVLIEDIPTLLAGLYRHGLKFRDETIRDTVTAEAMWTIGTREMESRKVRAYFSGRPVQIRYRDF